MTLLAIVPCRMGDSEIPNKCTREDTPDGISLLTRAMHFALELTQYVVVTTPRQPPVMPLQRIWWRERPADLCQPDVPMRDVVNDALTWRGLPHDVVFDKWVLLQPTTPSRTCEGVRRVIAAGHHVTCAVERVPADMNPERLRYMDDAGLLEMVIPGTDHSRQLTRQAYRRNGVAYAGYGLWKAHTPLYGVITDHHPTLDTVADWDAFTTR